MEAKNDIFLGTERRKVGVQVHDTMDNVAQTVAATDANVTKE